MAHVPRDNLHSQLVAVLKVALPLIALVLLSTLFLVSRKINPEDAIPYADVDVADRLREPKMTNADYAGVTSDGASLTMTASEAKPGANQDTSLRLVVGQLDTPDGVKTEIAAVTSEIDPANKMIELGRGAELRLSNGYIVTSIGFGVAMDRTFVESRGDVLATGPLGQLTADHLQLTRADEATNSYLLVFKGQVRLLYQPGK